MALFRLDQLSTWHDDAKVLNVIIETTKGSRNKYKYLPQTDTFELHKVLPSGMAFPFDFGFIPSTTGEDGDPLDVMVFMDEPVFTGCRVRCRLIGVIEAEQSEDGETERNDRLLTVAENSHDHKSVHSIKDLDHHLLDEVETFFSNYHCLDKNNFKAIGRRGPKKAAKLIEEGRKRFDKNKRAAAEVNGKRKATAGSAMRG